MATQPVALPATADCPTRMVAPRPTAARPKPLLLAARERRTSRLVEAPPELAVKPDPLVLLAATLSTAVALTDPVVPTPVTRMLAALLPLDSTRLKTAFAPAVPLGNT